MITPPITPPRRTITGILLGVLLIAGCADATSNSGPPGAEPSGGPTGTGPPPTTDAAVPPTGNPATAPRTTPPTGRPPSRPPKEPTDNQPTDRIAGRIVRGGSGPCYGLVTDDGTSYALHGPDVGPLQVGSFVRVTVAPLLLKIDCGEGIRRSIVRVEPV